MDIELKWEYDKQQRTIDRIDQMRRNSPAVGLEQQSKAVDESAWVQVEGVGQPPKAPNWVQVWVCPVVGLIYGVVPAGQKAKK